MYKRLFTEYKRLRVVMLAIMLSIGALIAGSNTPAFAITHGSSMSVPSSMVRISYKIGINTYGCDGTLIGRDWIVTAAHCVVDKGGSKLSPGAFKVAVGVDQPSWSKHWVTVKRVERHPNFPAHLDHKVAWPADVALLQLTQGVSNATMPLAATEPTVGSTVTFEGWGCTTVGLADCGVPTKSLMTATSTVKSDQQCGFPRSGQAYVAFDICTSRSGPSSTVRPGDSGGPMIKHTPLGARLAGVISASDAYKDFSTSIPYVLGWIHQITGIGAPAESNPTPPPPPAPGSTVYYHQVYHTCANGACGLRFHTGPGYSNYAVTRVLLDGTTVGIVCQTRGQAVSGIDGSSSNVWDRTVQGDYAADFYINTPGMTGAFSPPIPQC